MFRQRFLILSIVVAAGSLAAPFTAAQTILYVNDDAAGATDGSSWMDAFIDLQDALAAAQSGDQIWVAVGIYRPDAGSGDRTATFQLINGVALYGGFDGTETTLAGRAGLFDQTVLTGDLAANDVSNQSAFMQCYSRDGVPYLSGCESFDTDADGDVDALDGHTDENSQHVVTGSGIDGSAVLDGFTITAGKASGPQYEDQHGGGMYNFEGDPKVARCTFTWNWAHGDSIGGYGGGMANDSSSPTVIDCTFKENWACVFGGGMYSISGSPTVIGCTFVGNHVAIFDGGGMYCHKNSGNLTIVDCSFVGNFARGFGGGVYAGGGTTLTNCTFSGNIVIEFGGGTYIAHASSVALTNCTFSRNTAYLFAGGLYAAAAVTLSNCVFWGNILANYPATDEEEQILLGDPASTVDFTCVQGWTGIYGGVGNTGDDPAFVDADGADDIDGTLDDNLRLSPGSPVIDAGDDTTVTVGTDLAGNARIMDGDDDGTPTVDMGAYEFFFDCNENELPDACDLDCTALDGACSLPGCGAGTDCNTNDMPDECDIADGASDDCNDSGVPDECEPGGLDDCNNNETSDWCDIYHGGVDDCNENFVPDDCDIVPSDPDGNGEVSEDLDESGIPDECECFESSVPEPDRLDLPGNPISQKVRYVSFTAGDPDRNQAVRVVFQDLPSPYDTWNGAQLWVQEPQRHCEGCCGKWVPEPDNPPDYGCVLRGIEPPWYWGADLGCEPLWTEWSQYDVVHVSNEGIIPEGVYDIQVVDDTCWLSIEGNYSPALTLSQSTWADAIDNCATFPCGPPDGVTGIVDVTAILDLWKNLPNNIQIARADFEGSPAGDHRTPDQYIGITDVTYCLGAFLGDTYPGPGFPAPSPPPVCP